MSPNLIFKQLNPNSCRTYLLGRERSDEVLLVDPVLEHLAAYVDMLERNRWKLLAVIDTHTHADHLSAGPALKDQTGCDYAMHAAAKAACVTYRLADDFVIHLGDIPIRVLHTPGHTLDSLCLVLPELVLTGDTLFLDEGGAGRDDLPGGDPGAHWDSLQRLCALPDYLIVQPGHEYRNRVPSNLQHQKTTNPHLRSRTRDEFIDYVNDLKLGPADWMKDVLKANYACAQDPAAAWIPVDVPACEVKGTLGMGANAQPVSMIAPRELHRRLGGKETPLLLDVREPAELTGPLGHLRGVRSIPIAKLARNLGELARYRDQEIVVICRSGGRAFTAAQILEQAGFQHVLVLKDGMIGWKAAGLEAIR